MVIENQPCELHVRCKGGNKAYDIKQQKLAIKRLIDRSLSTNLTRLSKINSQLLNMKTDEASELLRYQEKRTKKLFSDPCLIDDDYCFPRSEYCARYVGTTAFLMKDPQYWAAYHRSEGNRFFKKAGNRKSAKFLGDYIKDEKHVAVSSHVGGYKSPFTIRGYQERLLQNRVVKSGSENVRDHVLVYQKQLAQRTLQLICDKTGEDFAFISNNYSCLMIDGVAFLKSLNISTDIDLSYWQKKPKMLNRFLMCVFIALMNIKAEKSGIPIEIVLRSSFGHYLPSVSETGASFRINIGLVPQAYATLMANVVIELKAVLKDFIQSKTVHEVSDAESTGAYNLAKMIHAVEKKNHPQLHCLKQTAVYKKFQLKESISLKEIEGFYRLFKKKNKRKKTKGWANFNPVDLTGKTLWQLLSSNADSKGMSVLHNCFRVKGHEDWFVSVLMRCFENNEPQSLEKAVYSMVSSLKYQGQLVSMRVKKNCQSFKAAEKRCFSSLSFQKFFEQEPSFHRMMKMVFRSFDAGLPMFAIYGQLERVRVDFFKKAKSAKQPVTSFGFGSDSEFELSPEDSKGFLSNNQTIYHKKLRVCSGMKAIVLSHLGVLCQQAINNSMSVHYKADTKQMYYEVEDALTYVDVGAVKHRIPSVELLYFDLNHANADHNGNVSLTFKIDKMSDCFKKVVVLDITSAALNEILKAVDICFSKKIQFVILVSSGLKNDQGAADNNPYGELRVLSTKQDEVNDLIDLIKKKASKFDKVPAEAHELVRVCKKKGLAISLYGLFKTQESRFKPCDFNLREGVENLIIP